MPKTPSKSAIKTDNAMRGPVRKAIDDNKYSLMVAWEKLDQGDREKLLAFVKAHTDYKDAHMGMMPLIALGTIFTALRRAGDTKEMYYRTSDGKWSRNNRDQWDRIKTTIWLQVAHRVKLDERLVKQRAKERRTA